MADYFLDIAISIVLSALKAALKDPNHASTLRKAMLKIYNQIGMVYGTDEAFVNSAVVAHKLDS